MGNAVDLKCPECGARMNAPAHGDIVTCEYCGTQTQVQRRQGLFERKTVVSAQPQYQHLPMAVQAHSSRYVGFMVFVTFLVPVAIMGLVFFLKSGHDSAAKRRIAEAQSRHSWAASSGKPMIADVNGDGVVDIVGRVLYFRASPNFVYAAIDTKTGQHLWETAPFHAKDLSYAKTAIVGDVFLLSDSLGNVTGYRLKDAKKLWQAPLGERVATMCAGRAGSALVTTVDKRTRKVALANGALEVVTDTTCAWVPTNHRDSPPRGIRFAKKSASDGGKRIYKLPGMSVNEVWERTADGVLFALGNRTPGTRVPVLARFEMRGDLLARPDYPRRNGRPAAKHRDQLRRYRTKLRAYNRARREERGKLLWKVEVPGAQALKATTSAPRFIGVAQSVVLVPYGMRSKPKTRLAAFSIADGKRLWDVAAPNAGTSSSLYHLAVSKTHAFLSYGDNLAVFKLVDGTLAFSMGRD